MLHLYRFVVVCLMLMLVPIGCQTQDDTARNQRDGNINRPQKIINRNNEQINEPNNQINRGVNDPFNPNSDQRGQMNRNNEQRDRNQTARPQAQKTADRMTKLATSINGVKQATAVVVGNYTLVGIDVDPTIDRNRVGTIKYSVAQALKDDPQGKNALVTADTDIMHRLRELNKKIAQGHPIAGLTDEIADIAARIVPQPSQGVQ